MYLLKYLNFSKGVLKRYVIYTILWMRSYMCWCVPSIVCFMWCGCNCRTSDEHGDDFIWRGWDTNDFVHKRTERHVQWGRQTQILLSRQWKLSQTPCQGMAYSHCTGMGPEQVRATGQGVMGLNILYRNVHTGPRQRTEPVSYCAGAVRWTGFKKQQQNITFLKWLNHKNTGA